MIKIENYELTASWNNIIGKLGLEKLKLTNFSQLVTPLLAEI